MSAIGSRIKTGEGSPTIYKAAVLPSCRDVVASVATAREQPGSEPANALAWKIDVPAKLC